MIQMENEWLSLTIEIEPAFRITRFFDKKNQQAVLTADAGILCGDRKTFAAAKFESCRKTGEFRWELGYRTGSVRITRFLECYPAAAAVRWYDEFTTSSDVAGMYYSDLAKIHMSVPQSFQCRDFFSCSDQSNRRYIEKAAATGKNRGGYFVSNLCWLYKEGPMPDCQPIKGEYDFIWEPEESTLSIVGLGFDNLRVGEKRRAIGVVIGLSSSYGMTRYRLARYAGFPKSCAEEVLSNSWPELTLGISEEAISQELCSQAYQRCASL